VNLPAGLARRDDGDDDRDDDRENNGYQRDDGEDLAQHPANADVLLIAVLNAGRLHLFFGLVSQVPRDGGEDGDEDAEDPENQDQRSLRMLLRGRSVRLAIWHRRLLTVWLRLPSRRVLPRRIGSLRARLSLRLFFVRVGHGDIVPYAIRVAQPTGRE